MRLFFALLPDAHTRKQLARVADGLDLEYGARRVSAMNLHITLAFIGNSPAVDLNFFREIGETFGLRRCTVTLDTLEHWPKSSAVVLTVRNKPRELAVQVDQLFAAFAARIHPRRDGNPWRAHVTLARKVAQPPVLTEMSPISWVSNSFCLMSSNTGGDESVYTVVDSWPLLDKPCD